MKECSSEVLLQKLHELNISLEKAILTAQNESEKRVQIAMNNADSINEFESSTCKCSSNVLLSFHETKASIEKEISEAERQDELSKQEHTAIMNKTDMMRKNYNDMNDEHQASVDSELDRLKEIAAEMSQEMITLSRASMTERQRQEDLEKDCEELDADVSQSQDEIDSCQNSMKKCSSELERESRICTSMTKAIFSKQSELNNAFEENKSLKSKIHDTISASGELSRILNELKQKQCLHDETMNKRQQDIIEMKKCLDTEKARNHSLNTTRLEIALLDKKNLGQLRQANKDLAFTKKKVEISRRDYQKRMTIKDSVIDLASKFENQLQDNTLMMKKLQKEVENQAEEIESLRKQVEDNVFELLSQQKVGKDKADKLITFLQDVDQKEAEILNLRGEERKKEKLTIAYNVLKDSIVADILRLKEAEKQLGVQCKIRKVSIGELDKRVIFFEGRIREFIAFEEAMKLERSNYKSLIKSSNDTVKQIKLKVNRAEIQLKSLESERNDRVQTLKTEQIENQSKRSRKDSFKIELIKMRTELGARREEMHRKERDMDTIKSALNEKHQHLRKYANRRKIQEQTKGRRQVFFDEQKNELEKTRGHLRMYEYALDRGRLSLRRKEDDKRIINLKVCQVQNKLNSSRIVLQNISDPGQDLIRVKGDIEIEKARYTTLSSSLEDPCKNLERCRVVGGSIPDEEELNLQLKSVKNKIFAVKEKLTEKDVAIEISEQRIHRIQNLMKNIRDQTNPILYQLNDCRWKLTKFNRKIIACVSELSMFQATALRLKEERNILREVMERIANDVQTHKISPGMMSTRERPFLPRSYHKCSEKENEIGCVKWRYIDSGSYCKEEDISGMSQSQHTYMHRTAAEARPVAYIPDEYVGIPKPYGNFAPFKPSESDKTANQHIRRAKDYQCDIQI